MKTRTFWIKTLLCLSLWVTMPTTSHGRAALGPVEGTRWQQFSAIKGITALVDGGKHLWVGSKGGLIRLNKATGEQTHFNQANSSLGDLWIQSLALDSTGKLWIGTNKGGLCSFDGANWKRYHMANSPIKATFVTGIAPDGKGGLWVLGTDAKKVELLLYRWNGTNWVGVFLPGQNTISNPAYGSTVGNRPNLQVDSEGNAWVHSQVGTYAGYTVLYKATRGSVVSNPKLPPNNPYLGNFIIPKTGAPFFTSSRKLIRMTPDGWDTVPAPTNFHHFRNAQNLSVELPDGTEYLAGIGLLRKTKDQWESIIPPSSIHVSTKGLLIAGDNDGTLWVAGEDDLYSYTGKVFSHRSLYQNTLAANTADLVYSRGKGQDAEVWTATGGLFKVWKKSQVDSFVTVGQNTLATSANPIAMGEDAHGNIWHLNQNRTLSRIGHSGTKVFDSTAMPPGTPSFFHVGPTGKVILGDINHRLWIPFNNGLLSINHGSDKRGDWKYHALPRFDEKHFGAIAGFTMDKAGALWITSHAHYSLPGHRFLMARYDGTKWTDITAQAHPALSEGFRSVLECDSRGHIWALVDERILLEWTGKEWISHFQSPYLSTLNHGALIKDAEGNIWTIMNGDKNILRKWNGAVWTEYPEVREILADFIVNDMAIDGLGRAWMATRTNGLLIFDPGAKAATSLEHRPPMAKAPGRTHSMRFRGGRMTWQGRDVLGRGPAELP